MVVLDAVVFDAALAAVVFFGVAALARDGLTAVDFFGAGTVAVGAASVSDAAEVSRAVRLSAARALPAAVWEMVKVSGFQNRNGESPDCAALVRRRQTPAPTSASRA